MHLFNNVTGHMLKVPEVKEIMNNTSNLVRYMKTSHAGAQLTSKLKSFPETRFNYAYDMLFSICENYDDVFEILSKKEEITKKKDLIEIITC